MMAEGEHEANEDTLQRREDPRTERQMSEARSHESGGSLGGWCFLSAQLVAALDRV